MTAKPLALSMGDPKGIGIELAAKAWLDREKERLHPFVLIGNRALIDQQLPANVPYQVISQMEEAQGVFEGVLPVYDTGVGVNLAEDTLKAIKQGVDLCLSGDAGALVTNPIQKKRLYDQGFQHPGHTEYLAELTGAPGKAVMMLACRELKVVPATIHIALEDVPASLTKDLLRQVIRTTHHDLTRKFGIASPVIAVAGLNPHAGEEGSMGAQEINLIKPLIEELNTDGLRVNGPAPADSLFHADARAKYDAAVCMYHDQALIPIKTIDFHRGVNVTLGLPIIRTSPDHGTADDIAGKGIANPSSLIAALQMAGEMASHKGHNPDG
ncbi:MAG: 4-hydroxythreonine-4-phosphate dehydrogenase PdxA [Sneathiellales bacterium]|nr:4-hydroxythreonine-4-phosphate dehydrogenase PdxA [Sneathiellales bacterium]